MRATRSRFLLLLATATAGCCGGANGDCSGPIPRACGADLAPGAVVTLSEDFPGGTEGLAFGPDGQLYVSTAHAIHRVAPDGAVTPVAALDSALGLAVWGDALHVAAIDVGRVYRLHADGTTATAASGLGKANFIAATPWDTLLVADDYATSISEVDAQGEVTTWLDGIPSPNGMGFSPAGTVLYVATTFEQPGLWRVPVSNGRPGGAPERWIPFAAGSSPDGLTVAPDGAVIVALNTANALAHITPQGDRSDLPLSDDLYNPASLAFPTDGLAGYDRCSLYVTSLLRPIVYRVRVDEALAGVLSE